AVNDDYCDCPDGSDEPGTPACEKGFFHCLNDDHIGADIPTSRVNDGICDPQCCDGSDEYLGFVKCHNNCTEIGATYRKEMLAKRRVVAEGEKIAREYAEFGAKAAADRTAEISILTNKIEKLDKKGAAATSRDCCTRVQECKKKVEEEQDKFLQLSDKLEALLGAVSPLGKAKPKTRRQDDWVRHAYEQYADYKLQFRGDKIPPVQDLADLEKEEQKEEEVPASTSEERNTEKPAASETPRDDSCAAAADVLASALTDPKQVVKCAPAIVSKYAVSLYDTVSTHLKATLGRVGSSRSAVPPPGGADVTKVAARLIEAEAVRTEATTKLAELRRLAEIDFGPAGVWEKLYRTCVTTETAEYTYEVCILDRAVQKPKNGGAQTGLGTFKRWGVRDPSKATAENAHHAMMYEDGDRCWNGPARSVEVTVECGLETKLLSVVEMSKCEYSARLTSPAVCDLSKLDVLPPAWHEHNEL
ncbi:glucosidase II beta subunit-like-domain-containing protein, partial [Geranomyces variabilis]